MARRFEAIEMNTVSAKIVFSDIGFNDVAKINVMWQSIADNQYTDDGVCVFVRVIQIPCKFLYSIEWGCQKGGEDCIMFEAECNPLYSMLPAKEYIEKWKEVLIKNIKELMDELDVHTAVITYSDDKKIYVQRFADVDDV